MSAVNEAIKNAVRPALISGGYVSGVTPNNGPKPGPDAYNPCSHVANAHRIVQHFKERLLYVQGIGWHTWGAPWRDDELGAAKLAQGLGKIIAEEAAGMASWVAAANSTAERDERQKAMDARFKWAGQSESEQTIQLSLQAARPHLACKAAELDANPLLLGLPNGVLDLATGEHREHRQLDRITKIIGCDFDPNATAPTWVRFINEVFDGDLALVEYVQRLIGYTLGGKRGEHLLLIFWGVGANGKTTMLGTLQTAFGDYAGTATPGLLIQHYGSDHPTGLADLQGRRFVVASETGEAGKLAEEQVKMLTGGDTITARRMRQDFYQFTPSHQLVLQTNHRPRITGTDLGIWRRIRLIPFTRSFTGKDRDASLSDKLCAELSGILTWAWHGWQRYLVEGLSATPEAVRAATDEYRESSDIVGQFIDECCIVDKMLSAKAGELYKRYCTWCDETGERAGSQKELGGRLTERGFTRARPGGVHSWIGIGIQRD